jgi:hypothetical protein
MPFHPLPTSYANPMCTYGECVTRTIYYRGSVVSDTGPRTFEVILPNYLTWWGSFACCSSNLMSPPTNAKNTPDHTSDDLVIEGESFEHEGDRAPKITPHRIPETAISLT